MIFRLETSRIRTILIGREWEIPLDNEKKTIEQPRNRSRRTAWILGAAVLLVLALLLATALVGQRETIFPGVSAEGVRLGGMTEAEAAAALREAGWDGPDHTVLIARLPAEKQISVTSGTAGWVVSADEAAKKAWQYGRIQDHPFSNFVAYVASALTGLDMGAHVADAPDADAIRQSAETAAEQVNKALLGAAVDDTPGAQAVCLYKGGELQTLEADAVFERLMQALARHERELDLVPAIPEDAEAEKRDMAELHYYLCDEPHNAYYDTATQTVVNGRPGVAFDVDEAERLWNEAGVGDLIRIPATITEPSLLNADETVLYADLLSQKSTSLGGSSANRVGNIALAASKIDNVVLMPGQSFSYNDVVGQRTVEAGFREAGAYADGRVVQAVGGGICQVSSTLYYCALTANLQIDQRTNHYFTVGYIEPGMDATVSWGGPEFVFTNNRTFPIVIRARMENGFVTVEIWGTDVDGSTVSMSYAQSGMSVVTYRGVYDRDGNLISKNQEATSLYHTHD